VHAPRELPPRRAVASVALGGVVAALLAAVLAGGSASNGVGERVDGRTGPGEQTGDDAAGAGAVVLPARPALPDCARTPEGAACVLVPVAASWPEARSPIVTDDTLYFLDGSAVVAAALVDGDQRWRRELPDIGMPTGVAADDGVLVVTAPGRVLRLDAVDGTVLWEILLGADSGTSPRVWLFPDGILAVVLGPRMVSLAPSTGQVRWVLEGISPEVRVTSDGLLVRTGTDLGLWAPDSATPRWRRPDTIGHALELPPGSILGLLSDPGQLDVETGGRLERMAGTTVLLGPLAPGISRVDLEWDAAGEQVRLSAVTEHGRLAWTTPVALSCCSLLAVPSDGDRLAVAAPDGGAALLDAVTGALVAQMAVRGEALVGVVGDRGHWRSGRTLVVRSISDQRALVELEGEVLSLDPLVLDGPDGLLHVRWHEEPSVSPRR
jgi:hypothetical protein